MGCGKGEGVAKGGQSNRCYVDAMIDEIGRAHV